MYYENLTYSLAAYIHFLEKMNARKDAYLAAVQKVESANSIYNEEYKKRADFEARAKLNAEYLTDLVNIRKEVDKLNKEIIDNFFKDITPTSNTGEAVMICANYMQLRGCLIDKIYLRQLATPLIKAKDYRGLAELLSVYNDCTRTTITSHANSEGIEFLQEGFLAVVHQDETIRRLRVIIKEMEPQLPKVNIDIASHANASPVIQEYVNNTGMLNYVKKLKDYLWEFDHPAEVAPIKAFNVEFTPVRTPKANSGSPAPATKSADDNPFNANFSKVR